MNSEAADFALCRTHAEQAWSFPAPPECAASDWWSRFQQQNRGAIRQFPNAVEATRFAQTSAASGFDHRLIDKGDARRVVNFKLEELGTRFLGLNWPRNLMESPLSLRESIVDVGGCQLSSIFLTHLYFYLRSSQMVGRDLKSVLEIGSGYGGLARIYRMGQPQMRYYLVDLPESLYFAEVFLRANFPTARFHYVAFGAPIPDDNVDFVFVPVQQLGALNGLHVDLVINTGSLQEMTDAAVAFWMNFIQKRIAADHFYSWNYFLNNKKHFTEVGVQANAICPVLDPHWEVQRFRINDPLTSVDCQQRNWLEVGLRRINDKAFDPGQSVTRLLAEADVLVAASNGWFAKVWMSIWQEPRAIALKAMLEGLEIFRSGRSFGVTNHLLLALPIFNAYDEAAYYLNRLSALGNK